MFTVLTLIISYLWVTWSVKWLSNVLYLLCFAQRKNHVQKGYITISANINSTKSFSSSCSSLIVLIEISFKGNFFFKQLLRSWHYRIQTLSIFGVNEFFHFLFYFIFLMNVFNWVLWDAWPFDFPQCMLGWLCFVPFSPVFSWLWMENGSIILF